MLVLNLPFKALMFLTLMRPSLVLFLVLWLKLVKDFLKVRCRLALLPFLISCLIWLDLVASLPLIKERILVIILLLHFLSLMLGSVTTNLTSKEAKMGKVMRHTLGASLNIRHNLSSSKGPKPLQLKLLTTYIPKTSAFTLAFSTSQRLRTTRASARTFFTFRQIGRASCRERV